MKSENMTTGRKALLLVDLQNDFVERGALAVHGGSEVIEVANALMPEFPWVVATQDWHPADHRSFASQNLDLSIGEQFSLEGLPQIVWPDHCVQHSTGAEFVPTLNQHEIDHVLRKGTDKHVDSYSGFFDNGHRRSTGLTDHLREQSVQHVYVMGLATDYCVRETVLDALSEGFQVTLIEDGCRGVNLQSGDSRQAIEEMRKHGAAIVFSNELLK